MFVAKVLSYFCGLVGVSESVTVEGNWRLLGLEATWACRSLMTILDLNG